MNELFAWLDLEAFTSEHLERSGFSAGKIRGYGVTVEENALFHALGHEFITMYGWPP
jgi:hypothetical protein